MDSAIAPHLRCPRTRAKGFDDNYQPPVPAWTAWSDAVTERVVMAYFGVQWQSADREAAEITISAIASQLDTTSGAVQVERARYFDASGYEILIFIAYWTDFEVYQRFADDNRIMAWWGSSERETSRVGVFREVFSPRTTHLETLISSPDQLDGIAEVFGTRSEDVVQEHAYWGAMRDRLPASQFDELSPVGELVVAPSRTPRRVKLTGHDNVAIIRSGQDWSHVAGTELDLYVNKMEPTLRAGMDFLSTKGGTIGCYSNRYLEHIDDDGATMKRSFGLSYWRSLERMETWAEHHPTHVAIFGGFMAMLQKLEKSPELRLYHEVSVVKADEQFFEYISCHAKTGMLAIVA
jgi:aldoxime dehydratase